MTLVLDEQHRYWLDGRRLSGVTEALQFSRILPNHEHTDPFYAERGTAIHAAIALWAKGELDDESLDPQIVPFLQNAQSVVSQLGLDRAGATLEDRVVDALQGVAGQLDWFGWSEVLSRNVLIDWKGGDFEEGHRVQVAGYWSLLLKREGFASPVSVAKVGVASLAGDRPRVTWVDPDNYYPTFCAAVAVHQWHVRSGSKEIA